MSVDLTQPYAVLRRIAEIHVRTDRRLMQIESLQAEQRAEDHELARLEPIAARMVGRRDLVVPVEVSLGGERHDVALAFQAGDIVDAFPVLSPFRLDSLTTAEVERVLGGSFATDDAATVPFHGPTPALRAEDIIAIDNAVS